jgi:hypothetical protein
MAFENLVGRFIVVGENWPRHDILDLLKHDYDLEMIHVNWIT